ncbi:MAG: UDP-N-acetylmuramoylalanine--D-glutamate ligase [Parcubacteria group bacterium Greene0714_7]|nr:MAG: UDP-N-acetylmuramoylalanine--D-glutamate ligase [Parcubacteria group bacterium Greene0714_7]
MHRMDSKAEFFNGKRITLMGLGLLGRGVGDAKFLAEAGAELIITDLKDDEQLRASLDELKHFSNIRYRLGGHELEDFRDRDFILKAAGVPIDSLYIKEARKNGIPIKMSASWFAELSEIPVVGVTGTRGKSTVTHLLEDIMKRSQMHVLLGGNVRGVSTLALLPEVTQNSIALMELDSWQCQGFGDAGLSPTVAVFTTFMPDHMNYYRDDLDLYLNDKAQVFLNQKPDDTLVVGAQVAPVLKKKYGSKILSRLVVADPAYFPSGWEISMLGVHNLLNAMCAIETARALGIDEEVIKESVATFKGVPGRLEFLREIHGVGIYNDNSSTTPEATLAALRAIPGSRAILIMGGADKGLSMQELLSFVPAYAKRVILLTGSGTERLVTSNIATFMNAPVYDRLEDALKDAMDSAVEGDLILFSPAFASFGMFTNEFDRGDQFVELVKKL